MKMKNKTVVLKAMGKCWVERGEKVNSNLVQREKKNIGAKTRT